MRGQDPDRPYRPVGLLFALIVAAVVGLAILGNWLRAKYGS